MAAVSGSCPTQPFPTKCAGCSGKVPPRGTRRLEIFQGGGVALGRWQDEPDLPKTFSTTCGKLSGEKPDTSPRPLWLLHAYAREAIFESEPASIEEGPVYPLLLRGEGSDWLLFQHAVAYASLSGERFESLGWHSRPDRTLSPLAIRRARARGGGLTLLSPPAVCSASRGAQAGNAIEDFGLGACTLGRWGGENDGDRHARVDEIDQGACWTVCSDPYPFDS